MNLSMLWIYSLLVSLVMLFVLPSAESTFLIWACMLNLPICPFRTTTVAVTTTTEKKK